MVWSDHRPSMYRAAAREIVQSADSGGLRSTGARDE